MRPLLIGICVLGAAPAAAQSTDWTFAGSLYAWLPGMSASTQTRFGTLDSDVSGSDALSDLDMAFMGTFEAQRGKWGVIGDLLYVDLSASQDTPFGRLFSDAETKVKTMALSDYVTYRVYEDPKVAVDLGGGFRAFGVDLDISLNPGTRQGVSSSASENWVDPLIAGRVIVPFNEKWFATAFADLGGTGSDDMTWQAFASVGYRFNERWSTQLGYRYMDIEKPIGGNLDRALRTVDRRDRAFLTDKSPGFTARELEERSWVMPRSLSPRQRQ